MNMTLVVNPFCKGTQVETVMDNAKVPCEIRSMPSCSMPLCSPVKSNARPDEYREITISTRVHSIAIKPGMAEENLTIEPR